MSIFKTSPVLVIMNNYLLDSAQPSTMSYLWNFGSLLGLCLVGQIISGMFLAMHYTGTAKHAFISVEHIMSDVYEGWLIRYVHSNTASFFFMCVYAHMASGLYYGSYRFPSTGVWVMGTIIFFLMMATAFLGYVLPFGQMSLWGATVITNLLSAIPWLGKSLVEFVWGGFSVSSATINSFFSLHFTLPFMLAALAVGHLLYLHVGGSSNPVGTTSDTDSTTFHPYYSFKDLMTVYMFFVTFGFIVFFAPDKLGHSDNYMEANSMQTPPSIVPEWYLLPFYAILSSMPNKLLGVMAMFIAMLILLVLPFTDTSNIKGNTFKPMHIFAFWMFVLNFMILMWLGSCHVEAPFILAGQLATAYYFSHYMIHLPMLGIADNVLGMLATDKMEKTPNMKINYLSNKMSYFVMSDVNFLQEDLNLDLSHFSNMDYSVFFVSIFVVFLSSALILYLFHKKEMKNITVNKLKMDPKLLNEKPKECPVKCDCLRTKLCLLGMEEDSPEMKEKSLSWKEMVKNPFKFKDNTPICGRKDMFCGIRNDYCAVCSMKMKKYLEKQKLIDKENIKNLIIVVGVSLVSFLSIYSLIISKIYLIFFQ